MTAAARGQGLNRGDGIDTLFDADEYQPEAARENPYIRRQRAMRGVLDLAAKSGSRVFTMAAPTGAGKNYVLEQFAADLVAQGEWPGGGWAGLSPAKGLRSVDEASEDGKPPTHRDLMVVVMPNKQNRATFVGNVRRELAKRGACGQDAVIELPANLDALAGYITAKPGACPFSESSGLRPRWFECVEARRKWCEQVEHGLEADLQIDAFNKKERMFRNAIREAARDKGRGRGSEGPTLTVGDRSVVRDIYPSARLLDKRPMVVALTPQKATDAIDTVLGAKLDLAERSLAGRAFVVVDEVDHVKNDILASDADHAGEYDFLDLVRDVHDRIIDESSEVHASVRGDVGAWLGEYRRADNRSPAKERMVREAAGRIAASWKRLGEAVGSIYGDVNLRWRVKAGSEVLRDKTQLFASGDLVISGKGKPKGEKGESKKLVLVRDEETRLNIIKGAECGDAEIPLSTAIARARGAVLNLVAEHMVECSELWNRINEGRPDYNPDTAPSRVVDDFGLGDSKKIWLELGTQVRRRMCSGLGKNDGSVYMGGVGYVRISDSDDHPHRSRVTSVVLPRLPEAWLASVARSAPVVAMSATWNVPSVKGMNWGYLQDVQDLVAASPELNALRAEIFEATEESNRGCSLLYDVDVETIPKDDACVASVVAYFSACAGAGKTPDETAALRKEAEETWRSLCPDEGFVQALLKCVHDEGFVQAVYCDEDGEPSCFMLERFLRVVNAVCTWARRVAEGKSYAAVVLTPNLLKKEEDDAYSRVLLKTVRAAIVARSSLSDGGSLWGGRLTEDQAAERVVVASAQDWNEMFGKYRGMLEQGEPAVLLTSSQTGGFSKNLQYKPPESIADKLATVDRGYGGAGGDPQTDVDFLYLATPTNTLVSSTGRMTGAAAATGALVAVAQRTEMCDGTYEIDDAERTRQVRGILDPRAKPVSTLRYLSSQAEGAKWVAQCVGRMQRAELKMKRTVIVLDGEIFDRCDFSWLGGVEAPVGYELRRILDEWGSAIPAEPAAAPEQGLIEFRNKDALFRMKHERLVAAAVSPAANSWDLENFDEERGEAIRFFSYGEAESHAAPAWRKNLMLRSPWPCVGYAWAEWECEEVGGKGKRAKKGRRDLEWARPEETDLSAARLRLEDKVRSTGCSPVVPTYHEVSWAASRAEKMLSAAPVAARLFEERGCRRPAAEELYHMTPYEYQAVYLGALGELVGEAIVSSCLPAGWRLSRGEPGKAEIGGDFVVLGEDSEETGVWVDFKHYSLQAQYGRMDDAIAEKYHGKAKAVGARRLLVVNIICDAGGDELPHCLDEGCGGERLVYSIPYLIKDGKVDDVMVGRVRDAITFKREAE